MIGQPNLWTAEDIEFVDNLPEDEFLRLLSLAGVLADV